MGSAKRKPLFFWFPLVSFSQKQGLEGQGSTSGAAHGSDSGRKLLPTDFLFVFRLNFVKTYRYRYRQRHAPAERKLRDIFCFSHRFWREILVKISASGTQTLEDVARGKFHAKFHDTFGREKTEKIFTSHFNRAAALRYGSAIISN